MPSSVAPVLATPGKSLGLIMAALEGWGSHRLGAHVLVVSIWLGWHLRMGHRDLVHLRSRGVCVSQCRAAVRLVRRVGKGHRPALVGTVELRAHVGTTARLIRGLTVVRTR